MSPEAGYTDDRALWSAAIANAKNRYPSARTDEVLRHFVFERFLARVFADQDSPFILKGGTALLARVHDARATRDVDLMTRDQDLRGAVTLLGRACTQDLGDHLRFSVGSSVETLKGPTQPGVAGAHVPISAYRGARPLPGFGVDLVVGSLMTAPTEHRPMTSVLPLRGLSLPDFPLYPLVDHIADKVCATATVHGPTQTRSTRPRDLVDLVIFAKTHPVQADELRTAITEKWAHSALPGTPAFDPPAQWAQLYPALAAKTPACAGVEDFHDAVTLVSAFLAPALERTGQDFRWDPATRAWTAQTQPSPASAAEAAGPDVEHPDQRPDQSSDPHPDQPPNQPLAQDPAGTPRAETDQRASSLAGLMFPTPLTELPPPAGPGAAPGAPGTGTTPGAQRSSGTPSPDGPGARGTGPR